MASPSAPAENPKASAEQAPKADAKAEAKAEAKSKEKVEGAAKETNDKVKDAIGPVLAKPEASASSSKPTWLEYTPLPNAPTGKNWKQAALLSAAVVNPVATGTIVGGVKATTWTWGKLSKLPGLRTVDRIGRAAYGAVKDGVSSTMNVALYPAKLIGTVGLNVAKGTVNTGRKSLLWAKEFVTDIFHETPGESKHILEQMYGGVKGLVSSILSLPRAYIETFKAHPKSVLAASLLAAGGVLSQGGFVNFSVQFAEGLIKIIQGIANKLI